MKVQSGLLPAVENSFLVRTCLKHFQTMSLPLLCSLQKVSAKACASWIWSMQDLHVCWIFNLNVHVFHWCSCLKRNWHLFLVCSCPGRQFSRSKVGLPRAPLADFNGRLFRWPGKLRILKLGKLGWLRWQKIGHVFCMCIIYIYIPYYD